MEIFELKYFLAVAQVENVNRAAETIHVSAGSLSKTIARLEQELQTPLFFRRGRGIQLTPEGQLLKKRATQIVQMEEDARLQLTGQEMGSLNVYLSSAEVLQAGFGAGLAKKIHSLYPKARIQFYVRTEEQALEQVESGEAHLALITQEAPVHLTAKTLAKVEFVTCVSREHPLYKKYGAKSVPIEEVLQYGFVSPDSQILGKIHRSSSADGWRDDKFPRQIKFKVSGLKLMENLLRDGLAVGYLPDYFVYSAGLEKLKVSGCPYHCQQTVRLVTKDPKELGWLQRLWDKV